MTKQNHIVESDKMVCRRCGGQMNPSKAIAQTYGGMPDFPGGAVVTVSPAGPGKLVDCLKCCGCGHSIQKGGA